MQIGNLHPYNEKQLEKDINEGKSTTIGIDVQSLYDEINALEINTGYNMASVVGTIKTYLMQLMGKITIKEEEEEPKKRA